MGRGLAESWVGTPMGSRKVRGNPRSVRRAPCVAADYKQCVVESVEGKRHRVSRHVEPAAARKYAQTTPLPSSSQRVA